MRILYVANGIPVPGTLGGSTHTLSVARGLARRGHDLHLITASSNPPPPWRRLTGLQRLTARDLADIHLYHQDLPKALTLTGAWPILRLIRRLRPDAIIERYYNFAGVGLWAARRLNIPALLEVNALIVDPPAVPKRRLDDLLGSPMRRWATTQCHWADRIITPLQTTVPPEVPRSKIVELPWGADIEHFEAASHFNNPGTYADPPVAVFLGSFRSWHGATDFVRAGVRLLASGHRYRFVLIGDGPERPRAEALAANWREQFQFTGAIPYKEVPTLLRAATVGVAPFTTATHPALQTAGFFWSPLKIYEYMAAGLPVVTTNLHPLNTIIREGQEGTLFGENDVDALAAALARLLDNPAAARAMGIRARCRVVEHYSWQHHCTELERLLMELVCERMQAAVSRG